MWVKIVWSKVDVIANLVKGRHYTQYLCLSLISGLILLNELSAKLQAGVVSSLLNLKKLLQILNCQPLHLGGIKVEKTFEFRTRSQLLEESTELLKVQFSIKVTI